jgi:hypothetical protein
MDEAEHALVRTRRDVARSRRRQLEAETGPTARQALHGRHTVALDRQLEPLVAGVELEVDRVAEPVTIDRHDPVAVSEAGRGSRRARRDRVDGHARGLRGTGRFQGTPPARRRERR